MYENLYFEEFEVVDLFTRIQLAPGPQSPSPIPEIVPGRPEVLRWFLVPRNTETVFRGVLVRVNSLVIFLYNCRNIHNISFYKDGRNCTEKGLQVFEEAEG